MQQRDDERVAGDEPRGRLEHHAIPAACSSRPRRVDVADLLTGNREVVLVYRGTDYRLRVTSNDKLILTK